MKIVNTIGNVCDFSVHGNTELQPVEESSAADAVAVSFSESDDFSELLPSESDVVVVMLLTKVFRWLVVVDMNEDGNEDGDEDEITVERTATEVVVDDMEDVVFRQGVRGRSAQQWRPVGHPASTNTHV